MTLPDSDLYASDLADRRVLQLEREDRKIWCVDEDKPAIGNCTFGGHQMVFEDEMEAAREWDKQQSEKPKEMPAFVNVLKELAEERRRQRDQHGWTSAHDDRLGPPEWAWLLQQRVTTMLAPTVIPKDMRRCLIELAAISTAAVEALDRAAQREGF